MFSPRFDCMVLFHAKSIKSYLQRNTKNIFAREVKNNLTYYENKLKPTYTFCI